VALRAAVVGGGLGGMAAALALARAGIDDRSRRLRSAEHRLQHALVMSGFIQFGYLYALADWGSRQPWPHCLRQ
jgi:glycine/D-amino acid oxidase-like deaminating enzyme